MTIRLLGAGDSFADLTHLLHRAYAQLAARGLRYWATWQDEDATRRRCARGECYVAQIDHRIVGTLTLAEMSSTRGTPWYERPDVASFSQFGVEPDLQRRGIGTQMLDFIEHRARSKGVRELACDTAEPAAHLIRWYNARGYRFIEYAQWKVTNYRSVILSKTLIPAAASTPAPHG